MSDAWHKCDHPDEYMTIHAGVVMCQVCGKRWTEDEPLPRTTAAAVADLNAAMANLRDALFEALKLGRIVKWLSARLGSRGGS